MIADQKLDEAGVQDGEPAWEEACRREDAIRDLLRHHPQRLTHAAVDDVAVLELARGQLVEQAFRLFAREPSPPVHLDIEVFKKVFDATEGAVELDEPATVSEKPVAAQPAIVSA